MMSRKLLFISIALLFLLSSQIFVRSAESIPASAPTKEEIYGLIDSGKIDSAKVLINNFIASNSNSSSLAKSVYGIADRYSKRQIFGEAKKVYKKLISLDPNNPYAKRSVLDMSRVEVCEHIDNSRWSKASALADKLIADNSGDSYLPYILSRIADYSSGEHNYVKAKELYNRLIQLYPQDNFALEAPVKILKIDVLIKIDSGNLDSADANVEQLIANQLKNPHFGRALYDIAKRYADRGYFDRARALSQRAVQLCPNDSFTERAGLEQIRYAISSKFEVGDFAFEGLLKEAIDKYPHHEFLSAVLSFAADRYTRGYKYDEAAAVYKKILKISPNSSDGGKAALELAALDIYKKIDSGDFTSADNLTEELIAKNPEHAYLPEVLYNIARYYSTRYYSECFNHELAKKLYSRLISLYPEDKYSYRARVEIAALDIKEKIAMGVPELAQIDLRQFKDKYEKDLFLARKCYDLADYCIEERRNYEMATAMLEMVVRDFPDCYYYHTRAKIRCEVAKICQQIKAYNLAEAQKAIAKLKQDYAGYQYLPSQLYFIAVVYSSQGHRDLSYALCDEIIKDMGESLYARYSKIKKCSLDVYSRLEANDLKGAKELLNQFKSENSNSTYFQEGLLNLAEEFYERALRTEDESIVSEYLNIAIDICKDNNIIRNPSGDLRRRVYVLLADAHLRLKDFTKSVGYFQKLVNEYPESSYSGNAQFMIGRVYENMVNAKLLPKSEGDKLIKAAYTNVLEKYPFCKATPIAKSWLANHSQQ